MKIIYFTHSLSSCWNHGNAHFLRGVLRELKIRGHRVTVLEPFGAWSLANLLAEQGPQALQPFAAAYPELRSTRYQKDIDLAAALEGADLVLVHEWTSREIVAAIGRLRASGATFRLLFHDTHHRAVSDPDSLRALDLSGYDGVLAFGEALAEVYRSWGWGRQVHVWHEAADVTHFRPPAAPSERHGLVWIGNWGDGERTAELERYLLTPSCAAGLPLAVFGVRYPPEAKALLAACGAQYRGWLANAAAPAVFAEHIATVHVPRRQYASRLPGIPTIRVFEALACGIPLVSAPWSDSEGLFRGGQDFLMAADARAMTAHLRDLAHTPSLRGELARSGLETILARHTCAHRVDQLLLIVRSLHSRDVTRESFA